VEVASRRAAAVVVDYAHHAAEAEQTADLVASCGTEAVVVGADVADDEDCKAIVAAAQRFGRVDALFNNAGITKFAGNHADLEAISGEDFIRLYQVNVIGAFQMIRAILRGCCVTQVERG
jgi:NAD(P)-dependent dehydrogenase (short-subunit alcohol dehydrogenase family)